MERIINHGIQLSRVITLGLLVMVWAVAPCSAAELRVSAGDDANGWINISAPGFGSLIMHAPAEAEPGTLSQLPPIAAGAGTPRLAAAWDGRLILIYRKEAGERDAAGGTVWPVREIHSKRIGTTSRVMLDGPRALPPIMTESQPVSLSATRRGAVVLLKGTDANWSLQGFDGTGWSSWELPPDFDATRECWLLAFGGEAAVIQNDPDADFANVWLRSESQDSRKWQHRKMAAIRSGAHLYSVRGQLLAAHTADGLWHIELVREQACREIASFQESAGEEWMLPVGDMLLHVWSEPEAPTRLYCRALSSSGRVLYDGPALTTSAINSRELTLLVLLMASILASVLVFVFRAETSDADAAVLPEGTVLASPARRMLAGSLDVLIGMIISAFIFGVGLVDWLRLDVWMAGGEGIWPLLTALGAAALVSTVGEWRWGRSVGKVITGCRVVSVRGGRLTLGVAAARNIVRFACPPLGMAWMLQTPERQMGLFGTMVITDRPEEPEES